jgi:integrase
MPATALTDAKIAGIKPPASGQVEVSDGMVPGLRIRVGTSGAKTFIVRKRIGGRVRNITVGRYGPRFGLADARRKARTILSDIEAGKDPTATLVTPRRAGKGAGTIRALWPAYKAAKRDLRSIGEVERIFDRHILPKLGDRLADAVTRADVTGLIDEIAADAPVMARAVLAQLSAFYTWALPALERLPANPCIGARRPDKPKSRDRVLSEAELVGLWNVAKGEHAPWGAVLKLLILTGQRRAEVIEARRSEFEAKAALWTIPGERAKNGEAHLVPLSKQALAVIESIPEVGESPFLFPAAGNDENAASGISKATKRFRSSLIKSLEHDVPDWTLHDIRRSVATGMQRLGIRLEVTEAVLNHISGSRAGIVRVYLRHGFLDEKRHALEVWAAEVDRMIAGTDRGNVVALRG